MKNIKAMLAMTSAYYQQQLPDHVIAMYAEDLADIPENMLVKAFKKLRADPRVTRFPLPAQIRNAAGCNLELTIDQEAVEVSNRILQAIGKFGHLSPDEAKEFIGELGWMVVIRDGGWKNICERTTNDDLPIIRAQWRELAKAIRAMAKSGRLDQPPTLTGEIQELLEDKK
jgi:hypothetical protein